MYYLHICAKKTKTLDLNSEMWILCSLQIQSICFYDTLQIICFHDAEIIIFFTYFAFLANAPRLICVVCRPITSCPTTKSHYFRYFQIARIIIKSLNCVFFFTEQFFWICWIWHKTNSVDILNDYIYLPIFHSITLSGILLNTIF